MFTETKTEEREKFFELMKNPPPELRTIDDYAAHLGVNKNTIVKWRKKLPKEIKPFDMQGYITDNAEDIIRNLVSLSSGSRNSKAIELALKLAGMANDKKENVKFELTVADRQQAYTEFIAGLRREAEASGVCPVCFQCKTLRD